MWLFLFAVGRAFPPGLARTSCTPLLAPSVPGFLDETIAGLCGAEHHSRLGKYEGRKESGEGPQRARS